MELDKGFSTAACNVQDLVLLADQAQRLYNKDIWYRGQANCKDGPLPSVHRNHDSWRLERYYHIYFQQGAPAVLPRSELPPEEDNAGWLVLMQHYGCPTRLLDWSASILVAAWFAVDSRPRCTDGVIWVLSPFHFNDAQGHDGTVGRLVDPPAIQLVSEAGRDRRGVEIDEHDRRVVAAIGTLNNPRIIAQQGRFTVHAGRTPLNELTLVHPHPEKPEPRCRIDIPRECKDNIRESLLGLGIGPGFVFPDLRGLAEQVRVDIDRRKGYLQ